MKKKNNARSELLRWSLKEPVSPFTCLAFEEEKQNKIVNKKSWLTFNCCDNK